MFWLLAISVPLLILFFWWSLWKRQQLTAQFVQSRLLAHLTIGVSRPVLKLRMALLTAAVTLLLIALARPLWGEVSEEVRQRGLDIIVAIDTSRSMLAEDIAPNRLTRARLAALDLMRLTKHDRLGLVAFAGSAFLQCPLTLDEEAFRQSVNALDVGIIPQGGTALAEAIETSLGAFKEHDENIKALVIFTDGEDHEEGALEAAEKAAKAGMRIFTVGVATAGGELLRVRDEKGRWDYIKDDKGDVVKSRLNEPLLTRIATAAEGFYIGLSGANTIDILYRQGLAPLPKSETATKMIRHHKEQFMWPLGLAILALLIEMLLPERRRVTRASVIPASSAGNEALRKAVGALAFILVTLSADASPGRALRRFEEGKFTEAQKEFEALAAKHPEDARLHYNAGAAAYEAGDYEKAAKHFQSAINPENLPLQESAYYNLGNTHFRRGEGQPEPQQRSEAWKEAVKNYESALKLNPNDQDARYNLQVVQKKIEELPKPPPQKGDSKNDPNQSKDDKDQQKNDAKDQKKDDQKNEQSKQDDKNDGQKKEEKKPQSGQQDEKKKDDQKQSAQDKAKSENSQPKEDKNAGKPGDQQGKEDAEATQAVASQMTKEQVDRLLDAQKGDEKAMIFQPPEKARNRNRIFKDW
jgi:Ca-activated chloride channel family protein